MAAAGAAGPGAPGARGGRRDAMLGWVGVALVALIVSFFAMFAFGEGVAEGFPSFLVHFVQMAIVLGGGALAIARPTVGAAILALPGLLVLLFYRLLLIGLPILLAAALLYVGRPQPKRLAYWIIVLVPLGVGLVTMLLVALSGE